jgi:hypothetical protein
MARVLKEEDLFDPVRDHLLAQGYTVRAEVKNCDLVARKGEELVVVELKRHMSIDLLIQATERQRITSAVYVAVPGPVSFSRGSRWHGVKRVLRGLELGLIVVTPGKRSARVDVLFHPLPYQRQRLQRRRRAILREVDGRSANHNRGGVTQRKLITAYRESAIRIACALDMNGSMSPRQLRALGTGEKTPRILADNHYGWFERIERGVYALTSQGRDALRDYADLVEQLQNDLAGSSPASDTHAAAPRA